MLSSPWLPLPVATSATTAARVKKLASAPRFARKRIYFCVSLYRVCVVAPGCHRYRGMSSGCVLSGFKESPLAVPSLAG